MIYIFNKKLRYDPRRSWEEGYIGQIRRSRKHMQRGLTRSQKLLSWPIDFFSNILNWMFLSFHFEILIQPYTQNLDWTTILGTNTHWSFQITCHYLSVCILFEDRLVISCNILQCTEILCNVILLTIIHIKKILTLEKFALEISQISQKEFNILRNFNNWFMPYTWDSTQ